MKPFVMHRPGFGFLVFLTICSTLSVCDLALDAERSSGNGLTVLGVGFFAVLAPWAILRLVFIRKMVLDSEKLEMTQGIWMQNSIPLAEWKRVQIWEIRRQARKRGLSFGKTESYFVYKVVIDTLRGPVELPTFDDSYDLAGFQKHMDALFLSLPVEGSRLKKFDGLLLDPVFGVPEDPYYDVGVALRPVEERLERLRGIPPEKPLPTRYYVYGALTCIVFFVGFLLFTPKGAAVRFYIALMLFGNDYFGF